jgi:hypothetical protein
VTRLRAGQPRSGGSIPSRGKRFFFLQSVQTGRGAHQISCLMGTGVVSAGVKRQGREDDHIPPSSCKVKNEWGCTFSSPYAFLVYTDYIFTVALSRGKDDKSQRQDRSCHGSDG